MTRLSRRDVLTGITALVAMPAVAAPTWPDRPIKLIHGFPPGGPVDTASRILAEGLSIRLGQGVIVEPKPGATGMIAAAQIARAAPDGYSLMTIPASYPPAAAMYRTLPFRPVEDFTMISKTVEYPIVLATYSGHSIRTLGDLVKLANSSSLPLQYGTAGVGSLQHLAIELFAKIANIRLQHVPYRGGEPAIIDLLGKRVDFVPDPPTALIEYIRGGQLRAIAVTSGVRFFGLGDVPTIAESGYPGYAVSGFQGLLAPAGLPAPILEKLNREVGVVLADPSIVERLRNLGNNPRHSSPEELRSNVSDDIARWGKVIADAHIERV
jgi:tripartite-type tricarboxylate transporter receptor subunit TctC